MRVEYAQEAEEDLLSVVGYVAERNPTAAADLAAHIRDIISKLAAG